MPILTEATDEDTRRRSLPGQGAAVWDPHAASSPAALLWLVALQVPQQEQEDRRHLQNHIPARLRPLQRRLLEHLSVPRGWGLRRWRGDGEARALCVMDLRVFNVILRDQVKGVCVCVVEVAESSVSVIWCGGEFGKRCPTGSPGEARQAVHAPRGPGEESHSRDAADACLRRIWRCFCTCDWHLPSDYSNSVFINYCKTRER